MSIPTNIKNSRRLFLPDGGRLTLDPRRWARAFRDAEQTPKVRRNPAAAARTVVRKIKANHARNAARTFP